MVNCLKKLHNAPRKFAKPWLLSWQLKINLKKNKNIHTFKNDKSIGGEAICNAAVVSASNISISQTSLYQN